MRSSHQCKAANLVASFESISAARCPVAAPCLVNQRIPQKLRASQLRKRSAKLRGRATDDSLKRAIEVRHGLKSACKRSFANSRVGIEQKRLRFLHSNSREVVDEIYPGRFLEHLAKVMSADVSRLGYAPER